MELPTKEDIEYIVHLRRAPTVTEAIRHILEMAPKFEGLLSLYDKTGLSVKEVDIHLDSKDKEIYGPNQIHSYNVGDEYSEEGFLGTIREIKANIAHR